MKGQCHHSGLLPGAQTMELLEMPPKPGICWWQVPCPGKGSSQPGVFTASQSLLLPPGPALRGPSDRDAVLHLCCDRDAGRSSLLLGSSVPCFPSPTLPDALCLLTSPLLLTTLLPPLSPSEAQMSQELELPPKLYPIGSRVNGQE